MKIIDKSKILIEYLYIMKQRIYHTEKKKYVKKKQNRGSTDQQKRKIMNRQITFLKVESNLTRAKVIFMLIKNNKNMKNPWLIPVEFRLSF